MSISYRLLEHKFIQNTQKLKLSENACSQNKRIGPIFSDPDIEIQGLKAREKTH